MLTLHQTEALAVLAWLGVIALAVAWITCRHDIRHLRAEIALIRMSRELPVLKAEVDSWTERVDTTAERATRECGSSTTRMAYDGPGGRSPPPGGRMMYTVAAGAG